MISTGSKINTLVLYSSGRLTNRLLFSNTLLKGIFHIPENFRLPPFFSKGKYFGKIGRAFENRYETLGYVNDWFEEILRHPKLDVVACNISNLIDYRKKKHLIKNYPLIIILHSASGDNVSLLQNTSHWFHDRKGILAVFIGNEYDDMQNKISFLKESGANFVCSQLPYDTAKWLYSDVDNLKTLHLPHGLNPNEYTSDETFQINIDVGFIGSKYPLWIGDIERNNFLDFMIEMGANYGLDCNIRIGNVPRNEWKSFLKSCSGIIGAEAGTYYLDKKGELMSKAKAYLNEKPEATFDEIRDNIFLKTDIEYKSGKAISSRHFEPIGTKSCQILLEGRYNDILEPGKHYLMVKKDLSNLSDIIQEFKDTERRDEIIHNAYHHVMNNHTYRHRIDALIHNITN